jgi:hypothetical protein
MVFNMDQSVGLPGDVAAPESEELRAKKNPSGAVL